MLRGLVQHALDLNERTHDRAARRRRGRRLLGDSPAMATLRDTIAKVARSQAPVYIVGESGVGKELVARTIHEQGARATGPFVPVNCGAIPAELMESEFFGHKKGSFTGAHADKPGLFQAADGGTLFLDEVAELPLPMQVKLLRAIQEKSMRPVGATSEVPVDVRILSATHKDLGDAGRRRPLPPRPVLPHQRDRAARAAAARTPGRPARPGRRRSCSAWPTAQGRSRPPTLTADALEALRAYPFPGNVRELENILERALALADGDRIERRRPAPVQAAAPHAPMAPTLAHARRRRRAPSRSPPRPAHRPAHAQPARYRQQPLPSYIEEIERAAIQQALQENRYNKTRTAAALGITFRALRYKLKKLGID